MRTIAMGGKTPNAKLGEMGTCTLKLIVSVDPAFPASSVA